MKLIFDQSIREQIESSLMLARELIPELAQQNMDLEGVDAFCEVLITESRFTIMDTVRKYASSELSIAYFGVLTTGMLSLTLELHPVFVKDWIGSSKPDPNLIISKMIVSMTNYALSIVQLVEAGLEASARSILRSFLELSWLIIVVSAKREKLLTYSQDYDDEMERKIYRDHFSAKKLGVEIVGIEKNLRIEEDIIPVLSNLRSSLYSYYSKSIHNAYGNAVIGAMAFSFEKDLLHSNLFGKADRASYPTLYHMNDAIFYFLNMFRRILEQVHGLTHPYPIQWQRTLALQETFNQIASHSSRHESAEAFKNI